MSQKVPNKVPKKSKKNLKTIENKDIPKKVSTVLDFLTVIQPTNCAMVLKQTSSGGLERNKCGGEK
jgi:hypothetical protein